MSVNQLEIAACRRLDNIRRLARSETKPVSEIAASMADHIPNFRRYEPPIAEDSQALAEALRWVLRHITKGGPQ